MKSQIWNTDKNDLLKKLKTNTLKAMFFGILKTAEIF